MKLLLPNDHIFSTVNPQTENSANIDLTLLWFSKIITNAVTINTKPLTNRVNHRIFQTKSPLPYKTKTVYVEIGNVSVIQP